MAGCGWTRQWALALFVLSAALLAGGEEKEATPEKEPGRQFNSKLPFRVWAQVEEDQDSKVVGETPSKEPLAIPSCRRWWVQPVGRPGMAALAKELDVQKIPGLQLFPGGTSDDDLVHLKELKGLQTLRLWKTKVTDAGLAHLKDLRGLQSLELGHTKVTDAGLAHLKELKGLQMLDLSGTQVTDAGLAHLEELKGLQTLSLWGTKVTDAGLAHLKDLRGLQSLGLLGTQVTGAGIAELRKSLPNVRVYP